MSEGLETHYDASTTCTLRFEPFSAVVAYEKGQGGVEGLDKGGGLTLVDTVHIERPPGDGSVSIEPSTVKNFDLDDFAPKMSHEVDGLLPSVGNPTVGCVEFFEGAEAHYDGWVLSFLLFRHFGLLGPMEMVRLMLNR